MLVNIQSVEEFEKVTNSGTCLIDFYADWCGPCKMLAPVLDQVADELEDVTIVKVNVDNFKELASKYDVMGIPSLHVQKEGKQVAHKSGFMPKPGLIAWINENK